VNTNENVAAGVFEDLRGEFGMVVAVDGEEHVVRIDLALNAARFGFAHAVAHERLDEGRAVGFAAEETADLRADRIVLALDRFVGARQADPRFVKAFFVQRFRCTVRVVAFDERRH
jgi:hypothetical protein